MIFDGNGDEIEMTYDTHHKLSYDRQRKLSRAIPEIFPGISEYSREGGNFLP
jgi:hypothetical protein